LKASRSSFAVSAAETAFVGRERQLAELDDAFGTMRRGQTVSVYVRGLSGMGKSTLVQAFLEQAKENFADALILQGRCYERESVPYKALDGVVDSLSKYLASLPREIAEALVPRHARALARIFPSCFKWMPSLTSARRLRRATYSLCGVTRLARCGRC